MIRNDSALTGYPTINNDSTVLGRFMNGCDTIGKALQPSDRVAETFINGCAAIQTAFEPAAKVIGNVVASGCITIGETLGPVVTKMMDSVESFFYTSRAFFSAKERNSNDSTIPSTSGNDSVATNPLFVKAPSVSSRPSANKFELDEENAIELHERPSDGRISDPDLYKHIPRNSNETL